MLLFFLKFRLNLEPVVIDKNNLKIQVAANRKNITRFGHRNVTPGHESNRFTIKIMECSVKFAGDLPIPAIISHIISG